MTATTGSIQLAHGRPFTVRDLEAFPDDSNRYELIDGMLLVSPSPTFSHQRMQLKLAFVLEQHCLDDFVVVAAPFDVQPSETTLLQPDVLVARRADLTEKLLPVAPVLAAEVLSPSTAINDFNNKRVAYERMGVEHYWVLDPRVPNLTLFEREQDHLVQVAEVKGEQAYEASKPFPVRVVPADLH